MRATRFGDRTLTIYLFFLLLKFKCSSIGKYPKPILDSKTPTVQSLEVQKIKIEAG